MPLARLLLDGASHRWALDRVLVCLVSVDITRLALATLGYGDELSRLLLDGDAPCAKLNPQDCLNDAVALDCWEAAEYLSLRVQRQTSRALDYWHAHHSAVPVNDSALRRVMVAVTQSDFTFRREVFTALAARGDVEAVHCLLVHMRRMRWTSGFHDTKRDAFRAAAEARQLDVAERLGTHAYCAENCKECVGALPVRLLVDQLASHGDLEALKKIHARGGHGAWNISTAISGAAENGHVGVVEWLLGISGRSIDPTRFEGAARRGQLEMLEWVWNQRDMRNTWVNFVQAAARSGSLDTLRWIQHNLDEATWKRHEPSAFKAAGQDGKLEVVRFFHEERGCRLDASLLKNLTMTTSVEFVEYVLAQIAPSAVNGAELVATAARDSNLDVVKYLTLHHGYWNRKAFSYAVNRGKGWLYTKLQLLQHSVSLEISRFLYEHAKHRASKLGVPLETQIDFSGTKILSTAVNSDVATARWLAECVVEVDARDTLESWAHFSEKKFPLSSAAQALIIACLRCRPKQCLPVKWLPLWAVSANCYEAFRLLVDMGHPNTASHATYMAITQELRDSRFMIKLLEVHGAPPQGLARVFTWAAEIGAVQVLSVINSRWADAARSFDRTLMLSAAHKAVQHGHVNVLQWFHECGLMVAQADEQNSNGPDDSTLAHLIQKAVKHEQPECLRWLVESLDAPTSVMAPALSAAASQNSVRVVRWITNRYDPSELELSVDDKRVVRRCLTHSL